MTVEELLKMAEQRNETEFLYKICKIVAESDSIGEGYGYCSDYDSERFQIEIEGKYRPGYLHEAGAPLYELYLKQIGVIE